LKQRLAAKTSSSLSLIKLSQIIKRAQPHWAQTEPVLAQQT
jgi:hypothetical protein